MDEVAKRAAEDVVNLQAMDAGKRGAASSDAEIKALHDRHSALGPRFPDSVETPAEIAALDAARAAAADATAIAPAATDNP